MRICLIRSVTDARRVKVGDTLTAVGVPVGIGLPYYTLHLDSNTVATVTYDGQVKYQGAAGQVVEFVSAYATMSQVEFILQALRPGTVQVSISATGEIHSGYPGPATWGGDASESILITVVNR